MQYFHVGSFERGTPNGCLLIDVTSHGVFTQSCARTSSHTAQAQGIAPTFSLTLPFGNVACRYLGCPVSSWGRWSDNFSEWRPSSLAPVVCPEGVVGVGVGEVTGGSSSSSQVADANTAVPIQTSLLGDGFQGLCSGRGHLNVQKGPVTEGGAFTVLMN